MDTVSAIDLSIGRAQRVATTIADVARLAGVSTATVSRYLVGKPVRTERAIKGAIEQLGFHPNHIARSLKSGRTGYLALVVPDATNPFFAAVVKGAESLVRRAGYTLVLYNTDESPQLESLIVEGLPGRVDGVILTPALEEAAAHERLREKGIPVIFLDREARSATDCDSVMVDNVGGACQAAECLLNFGHRSIAMITGPKGSTPGRERAKGFIDALASWNCALERRYVVDGGFREEGGYQAMLRLLAQPDPPTAVFTTNNLMTFGALHALHDLSIDVPSQMSLIGFDDHQLAPLLSPPLTVVDRPMKEQGAVAARLLLQRVRGAGDSTARRVVMDTKLVVRQSVGPPPRQDGLVLPISSVSGRGGIAKKMPPERFDTDHQDIVISSVLQAESSNT